MQKLLIVTGSNLKRSNSTGYRLIALAESLNQDFDIELICLDAPKNLNFKVKRFLILKYLSKLGQAIRYFVYSNFPARTLSLKLFEFFFNAFIRIDKGSFVYSLEPIRLDNKNIDKYVFELNVAPPNHIEYVVKEVGGLVEKSVSKSYELAISNADIIICGSEFNRKHLAVLTENKIFTLPRGLGYEPSISSSLDSSFDVFFVGNFTLTKGAKLFVEIARRMPNKTFAVVGNVPNNARFAEPNISYLGFQDSPNYKTGDVFLFLSMTEGSSRAVAEAMYNERICIVSEASSGQIDDGVNGYIVSDNWSLNQIAELIEDALTNSNKNEEIRKAAREKIMDIDLKYDQIIKNILRSDSIK